MGSKGQAADLLVFAADSTLLFVTYCMSLALEYLHRRLLRFCCFRLQEMGGKAKPTKHTARELAQKDGRCDAT